MIAVAGTTDVAYSTAWHYAAAFEQLGHDVERQNKESSHTGVVIALDGTTSVVRVGRIAGLLGPLVTADYVAHLFTDDGVWAAAHPTCNSAAVHYLRSACHGPEAHESEAYPPWESLWDVAFVGSSPGHSEWPHRVELVYRLREWFGDRFIHVGPGGQQVEDDSRLLWGYEDRPLRGHWLNRFYRSVPIVIGDSVLLERRQPYWSDRVYETWARGGFLIHPRVDPLTEEIGPYPSWELGDWNGLREQIAVWLAHPDDRHAVSKEMQELMRTRCTYAHRAREILATLGV